MAVLKIRIDEILTDEYKDFLEYCAMADKHYVSELTATDYIAFRTQFGVSRDLTQKIQCLIESYDLHDEPVKELESNPEESANNDENRDTEDLHIIETKSGLDGGNSTRGIYKLPDVSVAETKCNTEGSNSKVGFPDGEDVEDHESDNSLGKGNSELLLNIKSQPTTSLCKIWGIKNPSIFRDVNLEELEFPKKAQNAFQLAKCRTLEDLLAYSLRDLESLSSVGEITIDKILSTVYSYLKMNEIIISNDQSQCVFSENLLIQIYNLLLGESYSIDFLNENEKIYFRKCEEAKALLGEKLCMSALEEDSYVIKLKAVLDDFEWKTSCISKIRAFLSDLSEKVLSQPITYYWKAYYVSVVSNYLKNRNFKNLLDTETIEFFNKKTSLIKMLPDFFSAKEYSHESMEIYLNFVEWFCSDLLEKIHSTIENCIKQIDKRGAYVLSHRANGKTLVEIAAYLNVSRERVRQMELKAYQKFRHNYNKEKCDIVLTICAVRGGDDLLCNEEIQRMLCEDDANLLLYMLKRGGLDCSEYHYDKAIQAVVIGDHEKIDVEELIKNNFPDGIFDTELEKKISEISEGNDFLKERLLIEVNKEYRIYGKFYHRGRLTVVEVCDYILKHYFPNGYKIADIDYEKQFRTFMHESFGDVKGLPTGHSIDSKIIEVGLLYDRGVYIHPSYITVDQETISSINRFICDSPRTVLTYEEIFNSMFDELKDTQITNKYILHGVLNFYGCPYITRKDYVTKEASQNMIEELNRYIKNSGKVHISVLSEEFSSSNTRLYQLLARCPEVIGLDKGFYIHSSNLTIHEGDVDKFNKYMKSVCASLPVSIYMVFNDFNLHFTDFIIENNIQSQWDLFGILQYLFKDEFFFSRPYISSEDVGKLNSKRVLLDYLDGVESIEIKDLYDICKSRGINFIDIPIMLSTLQPEYLRINETTIMRSEITGVSEEVIYQTIELIQAEIEVHRYLPTNQITDFSWYPNINVEWTPYLIESIITNKPNDNLTYIQMPLGTSMLPTIILLGEEFVDDNYQSFVLKILKEEHENIPFNSKEEILNWLLDRGLCYKKLPAFLEDDTYFYSDDNGILKIKY